MNQQRNNDIELNAVKAIASASQTPFKTAFKVTMGIAVAQLAITAIFFGALIVIGTSIYLLAR